MSMSPQWMTWAASYIWCLCGLLCVPAEQVICVYCRKRFCTPSRNFFLCFQSCSVVDPVRLSNMFCCQSCSVVGSVLLSILFCCQSCSVFSPVLFLVLFCCQCCSVFSPVLLSILLCFQSCYVVNHALFSVLFCCRSCSVVGPNNHVKWENTPVFIQILCS